MTTIDASQLFERLSKANPDVCYLVGKGLNQPNYGIDDENCDQLFYAVDEMNSDEIDLLLPILKRKIASLDLPITIERAIGGMHYVKCCNPKVMPLQAFEARHQEEAIAILDVLVQFYEALNSEENAA